MYLPAPFSVSEPHALRQAIEQYSFATLVSKRRLDESTHTVNPLAAVSPLEASSGLMASHLPLLFEESPGRFGALVGHMARANTQWEHASGESVLAIFTGPHAYISPAWYAAPNTVPTWNYVAVHVTGTLELITEPEETLSVLKRLVAYFESTRTQPWSMDESSEYIAQLARHIVAFRIPIDHIEGKWKLSQNHPVDRRERVIQGLNETGRHDEQQVAALMAALPDS